MSQPPRYINRGEANCYMSSNKGRSFVAHGMYKQTTRRDEVPGPRLRRPRMLTKYTSRFQSVQSKPVFEMFDICHSGWNLTQLESTAKSQASGPVWFAVLLRYGSERDLPGDGPHPESGSLDATQTLVNGTGRREVQRAGIVITDAHPTGRGRHSGVLWNLRSLLRER